MRNYLITTEHFNRTCVQYYVRAINISMLTATTKQKRGKISGLNE